MSVSSLFLYQKEEKPPLSLETELWHQNGSLLQINFSEITLILQGIYLPSHNLLYPKDQIPFPLLCHFSTYVLPYVKMVYKPFKSNHLFGSFFFFYEGFSVCKKNYTWTSNKICTPLLLLSVFFVSLICRPQVHNPGCRGFPPPHYYKHTRPALDQPLLFLDFVGTKKDNLKTTCNIHKLHTISGWFVACIPWPFLGSYKIFTDIWEYNK